MKISVFYDHILEAHKQTGKALDELLNAVRNSGIEAVELHLGYLSEHPETVQLLQDADLKVSCIYEFYELGIKDESEKGRRHVETAVNVGAGRILVVPGFLHGLEGKRMQMKMKHPKRLDEWLSRNKKLQKMKDGLTDIVALGLEKSVSVTVEDFDDVHSPLSGMNGIRWFMEQIPELKYTLDTGNFLFYDESITEVWDALADRIVHVHCKDRCQSDNSCVHVGSGRMRIEQWIGLLKENGYDGYLAIEHFGVQDQEPCVQQSVAYLKGILA